LTVCPVLASGPTILGMGGKRRVERIMLSALVVLVAAAIGLLVIWLDGYNDAADRRTAQTAEVQIEPAPKATQSSMAATPAPAATELKPSPQAGQKSAPLLTPPAQQLPPPNNLPEAGPVPQPEAPVEDFGYVGPDEYVDTEDEVTCPVGDVRLILDEIEVSADSVDVRTVKLSGRVQNNADVPVDIPLQSAIDVIGIDSRGEWVVTVYPEVEYDTAPGEIRPIDVSLQPGETRKFTHDDTVFAYEWDSITHWVIDPISTYPELSYTEESGLFCSVGAPVTIAGEPIPAGS
jgi:hypothetical protein